MIKWHVDVMPWSNELSGINNQDSLASLHSTLTSVNLLNFLVKS